MGENSKMKRIKDVLFGVVFTISVLFVAVIFVSAYSSRGYMALGGEVFTVALPTALMYWKLESKEQEITIMSSVIHAQGKIIRDLEEKTSNQKNSY
jgi:hypothetical protein